MTWMAFTDPFILKMIFLIFQIYRKYGLVHPLDLPTLCTVLVLAVRWINPTKPSPTSTVSLIRCIIQQRRTSIKVTLRSPKADLEVLLPVSIEERLQALPEAILDQLTREHRSDFPDNLQSAYELIAPFRVAAAELSPKLGNPATSAQPSTSMQTK